jgi:hypothetical protein
MGIISQGILGPVSGQVGNVIGGSWKGIDYLRIAPASVANPQTPAQLNQRQRFSLMMGFLQPLTEFFRTGFKNYAKKMSGINAAMSYNIKNGIAGAYPTYAVDYPNILVSRGTLPVAINPAVASTVAGRVDFTWDDNSTEIGASAADRALLVVYNPLKHQVITDNAQAQRSAAGRNVTVPDSFTGDTVQNYIAFIDADGEVSNSRFAGEVLVA